MYSQEKGKFVLVTEEYYERALWMAEHCFHAHEPMSKSVGLQWSDDIKQLWTEWIFKSHMSIMMVDSETGEPMCLRTIRIDRQSDEDPEIDEEDDPAAGKILRFAKYARDRKDFYDVNKTDWCVSFTALCTSPKYTRQGLATTIMMFCLDLMRNLDMFPLYIKGEGASNFAKRIYDKLKFDVVEDVPYEDFKENGQTVIANTGEHKSMTIYCYAIRNVKHG